jgi:hypothetical protein
MSKLLNDFKEKIIGLYHNRTQAYSHPQQWAHIYVEFIEIEHENIYSKSWYAVESSENPYRETILKIKESGKNIIVTPINKVTNIESCDITFEKYGEYWIGENLKCIIPEKNMYVSTSLKFDGKNYFSRDAGYDLKTDRFLWGKDHHEGYFHFIKEK